MLAGLKGASKKEVEGVVARENLMLSYLLPRWRAIQAKDEQRGIRRN